MYVPSCGCLLETFEQIRKNRPTRQIPSDSHTLETFSLATLIGLGDTPKNSKWARAAANGIADYIAAQEALVPA